MIIIYKLCKSGHTKWACLIVCCPCIVISGLLSSGGAIATSIKTQFSSEDEDEDEDKSNIVGHFSNEVPLINEVPISNKVPMSSEVPMLSEVQLENASQLEQTDSMNKLTAYDTLDSSLANLNEAYNKLL